MNQRVKPLLVLLLVLSLLGGGLFLAVRAEDSGGDESADDPLFTTYTEKAMLLVYLDGSLSDELSGSCIVGKVQTLTAPDMDGKAFSYWALNSADGSIVSTQNPYQLAVYVNTTLYAVYTNGQPEQNASHIAFTALAAQERFGEDALRMTATYSLPAGSDAQEAGIVYTNNQLLNAADLEKNLMEDLGVWDMTAILQSGDQTRTRTMSSSSIGGTKSGVGGAAGDWTLFLTPPRNGGFVYAAAYVKAGGETIWSDPATVRYADLTSDTFAEPDFDYNFTPTDEQLAEIASESPGG